MAEYYLYRPFPNHPSTSIPQIPMDPSSQIQFEFHPLFRQYKSGRFHRFVTATTVPASVEPATGVASKDVIIDPSTGVAARLYLPHINPEEKKKLPVLVYHHGGCFVIESAFSPLYHNYLNSVVARAQVLAVSVEYRRAPEHPLPAAYDDSWAALNWVASHAGGGPEPWLAVHGDMQRVYLAGDSAGANIAHNMAMRAGSDGLAVDARIKGLGLAHPYFWGKERLKSEKDIDPDFAAQIDGLWGFVCSATEGLDDPRVNPVAKDAPSLKKLGCEKVLVFVAEKDELRERGKAYYEGVKKSGYSGEVEFVESEGETHCFHLQRPDCAKAVAVMDHFVAFLNGK